MAVDPLDFLPLDAPPLGAPLWDALLLDGPVEDLPVFGDLRDVPVGGVDLWVHLQAPPDEAEEEEEEDEEEAEVDWDQWERLRHFFDGRGRGERG